MKGFASDNNSGVHPVIMEALANVNSEHSIAYGDDETTYEAENAFKKTFGNESKTFFVFNGTGANVTGIGSVLRPFNAVICAETAHINTDECGAPEKNAGCKLLTVPAVDGKIKPENIEKFMHAAGFQHHSQPKVVSVSQATEQGTLYAADEIKQIADCAHNNGLLLHIDGARIANAAAALNCRLADITVNAGADFMSFGGTKNGLMFGEAVVFFRPELAENFMYIRKQNMQLASKMRYISAQFSAYLKDEQWRKTAEHSNKMAKLLAEKTAGIPEIKITRKVEANSVFVTLPKEMISKLQAEYFFYVWDESISEVRWMTSWDTDENDIIKFTDAIKRLIK